MAQQPIPPPFPFVEYWPQVFAASGHYLGNKWLCPSGNLTYANAASSSENLEVISSQTQDTEELDKSLIKASRLWRKDPEKVAQRIMNEEIGRGVFEDEAGQLVELRLSAEFRKRIEKWKRLKAAPTTSARKQKGAKRQNRRPGYKDVLGQPKAARAARFEVLQQRYGSQEARRLAGLEDELDCRYSILARKKGVVAWPGTLNSGLDNVRTQSQSQGRS